jgi:integrase
MTSVEAAEYVHQYAGHSLRAGHATMAAANDAPGYAIQQQLRHRKFDTTAHLARSAVQTEFRRVIGPVIQSLVP